VVTAALLGVFVLGALTGCGSSRKVARQEATTTTTVSSSVWSQQAKSWLALHAADLTGISSSANTLAKAVKAGKVNQADFAISQFVTAVGHADVDLPKNAFGQQVHQIFTAYVVALSSLRNGLTNNNQAEFQSGSVALSSAVAQFTAVTRQIVHPG
jgi:hypothetical protein